MLDRLLIAAVIALFAFSVYAFTRGLHMVSASRVTAAQALPRVLYFRTDNCGPCTVQARYLEEIRTSFADRVAIEKIDADRDLNTAARYGVFTVPTTLVVDRMGKVRHINYGLTDARKLASQVRSIDGA